MSQNESIAIYSMLKEIFSMSNKMTEYCFKDCIMDFNHSYLENYDKECIEKCLERYIQSKKITEKCYKESAIYLDKSLKMGLYPEINPIQKLPRRIPNFILEAGKQKSHQIE